MSDAPTERPDPLLEHLDRLYTFAQAMVLDASAAARLVEVTYARAYATPPEERPLLEEQTWLYNLMMQAHREEQAGPERAAAEGGAPQAPVPADFRRRLAEQLVDRKLPTALASLPEDHRLLLLLSDGEGLSCREAGRVLELEEETACQRLEIAQATLQELLLSSVTTVERPLIEEHLPPGWVRAALQRLTQSEFIPLPPTLRQSVAAIAREQRSRPRPEARLRARRRAPGRAWMFVRRAFAALVLIGTAGLLGYTIADLSRPEPDTNLITLSAEQAGRIQPTFRTGSPEQAERFIHDRLGWRLTVPTIDGASLAGVGISEVVPGVEAPAFLFENASGEPIVLFAYSYAFLDRFDDRIHLDADVLRQIEDDQHFDLYDLEEDKVLVWRNRDDIYMAVTRDDAESLSERIFFPS